MYGSVMKSHLSLLGFDEVRNGTSRMRGVVVGNEVDLLGFPVLVCKTIEAVGKEYLALFCKAPSPGPAVMETKPCHEMSDPVADVFMLTAFDMPGLYEKGWKTPLQSLYGRLLI